MACWLTGLRSAWCLHMQASSVYAPCRAQSGCRPHECCLCGFEWFWGGFGVVLPSCRALAAVRLDVSLGASLGGGWFAVYMVRGRSYNALPALVLPMRNAALMFCTFLPCAFFYKLLSPPYADSTHPTHCRHCYCPRSGRCGYCAG